MKISSDIKTMSAILLLSLLLGLASSAPTRTGPPPRCEHIHGQCEDLAINFIRQVETLQDCRRECASHHSCRYYSYHSSTGSGAHDSHCYLYTSCTSLRHTEDHSSWVSGSSQYHDDCYTAPFIVAVHNLLRPT